LPWPCADTNPSGQAVPRERQRGPVELHVANEIQAALDQRLCGFLALQLGNAHAPMPEEEKLERELGRELELQISARLSRSSPSSWAVSYRTRRDLHDEDLLELPVSLAVAFACLAGVMGGGNTGP
jgi:hypothetical protein